MGKVKSLMFSNDNHCDIIDKTTGLITEQFNVGLATYDTIIPPAFIDSNGVEYRLYDRGVPFALQRITPELLEKFKKTSANAKVRDEWKYSKKELEEMGKILNHKEEKYKSLKSTTLRELKEKGYLPVYRGFSIVMFRKPQIERWYGKGYAHTPEVNHQLLQGNHAKNAFGEKERKREFSFALAGFMFGVLLLLAILLPIIAGLVGQLG